MPTPTPTPTPNGLEVAAVVEGLVLKRTLLKDDVEAVLFEVEEPIIGSSPSPPKKLNCESDSEDVSVGKEAGTLKVELQVDMVTGVGEEEIVDAVPDEMTLTGCAAVMVMV